MLFANHPTCIQRIILYCLVPLSYGWSFITSSRRWLYSKGIFTSYRTAVPVISVGNVVCGGTGKTPCIDLLLDLLPPCAVVSRGYGTKINGCVIEKGALIQTEHDETRLLAQHHPHALFVLSKSKLEGVKQIEKNNMLILIDDGFQHLQLQRDLDIVVVNAQDPLSNGYLLPRGLLRESPRSLQKASLIVLNYARHLKVRRRAIELIRLYTEAPIVSCSPAITEFVDISTKSTVDCPKRVAIVSGIGSPDSFQSSVEELGIKVISRLDFGDHQTIDPDLLIAFVSKLEGVDALLITEKDAVRQAIPKLILPVLVAHMKLSIIDGADNLFNLLRPYIAGGTR